MLPAHRAAAGSTRGRTLQIATSDSALAKAQHDAIGGPFLHNAHVATRFETWDGNPATLNRMVAGSAHHCTLVLMEDTAFNTACHSNLLVHAFPAGDADPGGCRWPALQTRTVLAWDRGQIDTPPTWSDFWDVARHPGKRALRRDPRTTLEIALMADGVAAQDVYATLSTADGVARAFRKLNQIRPYLVWWQTPDDAARILNSGSALMASIPQGAAPVNPVSASAARHTRSFGIQTTQSVAQGLSWGIVAGSTPTEIADARDLLAFSDTPAIRADLLARYPALPHDARPDGVLQMDPDFWNAHIDSLQKQFGAWLDAPA